MDILKFLDKKYLPITFIAIEDIRDWKPGLHPIRPESNYEELKEDIKKNGLKEPLIVRKNGNAYYGVDGTHRYYILKELGYKIIPCYLK